MRRADASLPTCGSVRQKAPSMSPRASGFRKRSFCSSFANIIPMLQKAGAEVIAFDPAGMEEARKLLPGVTWAPDAYDALKDADAVAIVTEWNDFREPDFARMKRLMRQPVIFDGRNLYDPAQIRERGFEYTSIGRP